MESLVIGLFTGALGLGYFIYGKKMQLFVPMVSGGLLCALPYVIDSNLVLILVSLVAMVAPFVLKF
jgi:hypothetical protein